LAADSSLLQVMTLGGRYGDQAAPSADRDQAEAVLDQRVHLLAQELGA